MTARIFGMLLFLVFALIHAALAGAWFATTGWGLEAVQDIAAGVVFGIVTLGFSGVISAPPVADCVDGNPCTKEGPRP